MKDEMEVYIGTLPNYGVIQTTILNSSDWMGFLTSMLAGNQVVLVSFLCFHFHQIFF
jgi:hypothetical protein